ncbi:hypothetical protein JCM8202_000145 [Rhodotorula sphaerocarpa]
MSSALPSASSSSSPASHGVSDSASTASSSRRTKRNAAEVDYAALEGRADSAGGHGAYIEAERPNKRRAPRSTAAEKQARKVARMERNRIAAQLSRDKKKQQQELLEARIHQLEDQLAHRADSVQLPVFAEVPAPPTAADPALVDQLRDENETLKTQLALEKLHSQGLQVRLAALESKFSRLEHLLEGGRAAGPTLVAPKLEEVPLDEPEKQEKGTRGRFIPAAEAVHVPPVPSSSPVLTTLLPPASADVDARDDLLTSATSDFSSFGDFHVGAEGADIGFSDGLQLELGDPSEPARDSRVDSAPSFGDDLVQGSGSGLDFGVDGSSQAATLCSDEAVSAAWLDWSLALDSTRDGDLLSAPPPPSSAFLEQAPDFDLVAFLRENQQDAQEAQAAVSYAPDAALAF